MLVIFNACQSINLKISLNIERLFIGDIEVCLFKTILQLKGMVKAVLLICTALLVTSCLQTDYSDLKPTPADANAHAKQQIDGNQSAENTELGDKAGVNKNKNDINITGKKSTKNQVQQKASSKIGSTAPAIKLNAPWKCVPKKLKTVIIQVSKKFGRVIVNSTRRSSGRNRRIGGAKRSWHIGCRAVDFRVKGNTRGLYKWLRNHPNVGGLKRYRSGFYHIDIGPKRSW